MDSAGTPTDLWREARAQPQKATARGVREGYKLLFQIFPDAERKDQEAITNFFKAKTSVGDAVIKMMVATFRTLAQYGDFSGAGQEKGENHSDTHAPPPAPALAAKYSPASASAMSVNLNIELSLPADETGKVYEAFFAAMKKHIIDASQ